MNGTSRRLTANGFLFLLLCCTGVGFGQKRQPGLYKSTYRLTDSRFAVSIPDTVFTQMGLPNPGINISAGALVYTVYYQGGLSKLEIGLEKSPGIQLANEVKPAMIYTKPADSVMVVEENGKVEKIKFFLPVLTPTAKRQTINGYKARLYTYTNSAKTQVAVWISKDLLPSVAPGIYYPLLGGIVRMESAGDDYSWTLDLVGFEKSSEAVSFKKAELTKPDSPAVIHMLFR